MGAVSNVVTIPAPMHSSNNFELDISSLQTALDNAKQQGITVKALLISSPNNPMGVIYTKEQLIQMYQWTKSNVIFARITIKSDITAGNSLNSG